MSPTQDNSADGPEGRCEPQPNLARDPALDGLLTEREWQVLDLRALGRESKEIAAHLTISESTVKNHISSIYQKLHVHNLVEAIHKAYLRSP